MYRSLIFQCAIFLLCGASLLAQPVIEVQSSWDSAASLAKKEKKKIIIDLHWSDDFADSLRGDFAKALFIFLEKNAVVMNHWGKPAEPKKDKDGKEILNNSANDFPREFEIYDVNKKLLFKDDGLYFLQKSRLYTRLLYLVLLEAKIKALVKNRATPEGGYYKLSEFKKMKGKTFTIKNKLGISSGKIIEIGDVYFVFVSRTGSGVVPFGLLDAKLLARNKIDINSELKDIEALKEYRVVVNKILKEAVKGQTYFKRGEKYFAKWAKGKAIRIKDLKTVQTALAKLAKPMLDNMIELGALADRDAQLDIVLLRAFELHKKDLSRMFTWMGWTSYWVPSRDAPTIPLASADKKAPKKAPVNGLLYLAQKLDYENQFAKEAQR